MGYDENASYLSLRKAISERPKDFVAIVGAGVSAQSGLPTWEKLVDLLLIDLEKHIKSLKELRQEPVLAPNIEILKKSADTWYVMGCIRNILERALFESRIKYHLKFDSPPPPPDILVSIWRLGIKGIVTPNLDTLASDAYAKCFSRAADVSSARSHKYLEFLGDERNFVFQPHGELSDSRSWVLTNDKLADLIKDESYKNWWDNLLSSRNLIFIGVNESDVSIKSYILNNTTNRTHYVIAPIEAANRMPLLKNIGFQLVPYRVQVTSENIEDHSELQSLIGSLLMYTSKEVIPPAAYTGSVVSPSELPSPQDLQKLQISDVRTRLNAAVASILPKQGDAPEKILYEFEALRKKYLFSFMGASAVEPNTDYDLIHGYRVIEKIGEGGFGAVYFANRLSDKKKFAIKVIHPQIIQSGPHLNAFRRGAYAMRVLTKKKISGMVLLESAFEVPFSIIMEYIDGYDLERAIKNGALPNIADRLAVVREVARIVYSAHCTEEQILHRDIKPGNVLLIGYSYEPDTLISMIRVTDFDLCWHRYATAQTVVHHEGSQGYAAPEIFDQGLGSTRKAWVDVYGLGMLLYFILSEKHPVPGMTSADSFEGVFSNEIRGRWKFTWESLAWYLARCVRLATNLHPQERPSVPDFIDMLNVALSFQTESGTNDYLPIIAMQLVEMIKEDSKIKFLDFGRKLELNREPKELSITLEGKANGVEINASVRLDKGLELKGEDKDKRDQRVGGRIKQIASSSGCEAVFIANAASREALIKAKVDSVNLLEIKKIAETLARVWHTISQYS